MESDERKERLKLVIRRIHEGAPVDEVKKEFREAIEGASVEAVAMAEEELIKEGMPRDEVHRLCSLHLEVFEGSLGKEGPIAPAGHPVHTLMEEHRVLQGFASELVELARKLADGAGDDVFNQGLARVQSIVKHLKESESHYVREENVLFPAIERHGITEPPAIMWSEHDRIRALKKELVEAVESEDAADIGRRLGPIAARLSDLLADHFRKENGILFPTALKVVGEGEWDDVAADFDDLGYCCFTPPRPTKPSDGAVAAVGAESGDEIVLETGRFTRDELEAMLNALPVDITFVGADDTVRFFSQTPDRIFPRTKSIIGRTVQNCHPKKSLHVVNEIVNDFKAGKRDSAEFWINMGEKVVYIRYFPVRGRDGGYLGCLEVTQDIAPLKGITGEKRLL